MPSQPAVKALLITNPNSRQGAVDELQEGVNRLHDAGFDVEQVQSNSPSESRQAVESRSQKIDLVILAGGDGTISSMAETLLRCKLAFAVLPMGTANDLARSLGVAGSLDEAFNAIISNHRQRIDIGAVDGHYFFNTAQIGLGVKVAEELTDDVKKRWGVFSYLKALFAALARSGRFTVRVNVDGRSYRMKSMHLAVGNGRFYGGGNIICEDAYIDDGLLSLYSLKPQKAWKLLFLAPLLRMGSQQRARRIFTATGRQIDIRTTHPMAIYADGEPISQTPARFEVHPAALEAIMTPQPHPPS